MFKLYNCKSVEEYNDAQYKDCRLTQDEFELLKRWYVMEKVFEALEWLENKCYVESPQEEKFEECCSTIKQALIQAEIDKKQLELYIEENTKLFSNLVDKSKKELAFDYLIKHFNIECGIDSMPNGEVWARFIHIQSKEDEGTWDTTATANLVDYEEEFNLLKEMLKYYETYTRKNNKYN